MSDTHDAQPGNSGQQQTGGGGGQQSGGDGKGGPWYAAGGLDTESAKWIDDQGYSDMPALVKAARSHQQLARDRNAIKRWDPKAIDKWEGWKELGVTDKPEDYKFDKPTAPDGMTFPEKMFDDFRKDAHALKIPPAMAGALFSKTFGHIIEGIKELEANGAKSAAELDTKLKEEWGGSYEAKKELARRAWKAFGIGLDDSAELEKVIGAARLVKLGHMLGEKIGEDKLVDGKGGGGFGGMSKEQAGAERRRLEGDAAWMKIFSDRSHPLQRDYAAQRQKLINIEAGAGPNG